MERMRLPRPSAKPMPPAPSVSSNHCIAMRGFRDCAAGFQLFDLFCSESELFQNFFTMLTEPRRGTRCYLWSFFYAQRAAHRVFRIGAAVIDRNDDLVRIQLRIVD